MYKNICNYWWLIYSFIYQINLTLGPNNYLLHSWSHSHFQKKWDWDDFQFHDMDQANMSHLVSLHCSPTRVLAFWNTWFSISMLDFVIGEADDLTASSLKNVVYVASYTLKQILLLLNSNIMSVKVVDSINNTIIRQSSYWLIKAK